MQIVILSLCQLFFFKYTKFIENAICETILDKTLYLEKKKRCLKCFIVFKTPDKHLLYCFVFITGKERILVNFTADPFV